MYKSSGEARSLSFTALKRRQANGCTFKCLLHLADYKQGESQYLTFHSPVTQFIFSLNPQNQNLHNFFVPATRRLLQAVWSWRRPRLRPAWMWVNNNLSNYMASHSGTPYSPTLTGVKSLKFLKHSKYSVLYPCRYLKPAGGHTNRSMLNCNTYRVAYRLLQGKRNAIIQPLAARRARLD